MADFTYRARSADGAGIEGTVQASNAETAAQDLCDAGLTPIEIRYADGRFNYDVSLQKGVTGDAPRWTLAADDGSRAIWKTPKAERVAGAVFICVGVLWWAMTYYMWTRSHGFIEIGGTVCFAFAGLIPVLCGIALILKKERMMADRVTGTLELGRSVDEGSPTFKTADVQKIVAAWVFTVENPQRSSAAAESRNRSLCLVAEVSLIKTSGQVVQLEYCSDGEHAGALAAKVA